MDFHAGLGFSTALENTLTGTFVMAASAKPYSTS
jgi:hypothetical protein